MTSDEPIRVEVLHKAERGWPLGRGNVRVFRRVREGDPDATGYYIEANVGGVIVEGAGHYGDNWREAEKAARRIADGMAAAPPAETGEVVTGFVVKGFGRSPRDIEMDRGPLRNIANRMEEGDRVRFRLLPPEDATPVDPPTGECETLPTLRVSRTLGSPEGPGYNVEGWATGPRPKAGRTYRLVPIPTEEESAPTGDAPEGPGWCDEHGRPCAWACEMECFLADSEWVDPPTTDAPGEET